jgi:hypothetical protein
MKTSGKPAAPMGRNGTPRMPKKVKMSKTSLGTTPATGLKSPKAGPNSGM